MFLTGFTLLLCKVLDAILSKLDELLSINPKLMYLALETLAFIIKTG